MGNENLLQRTFNENFICVEDLKQLTRVLDRHRSCDIVLVCPESEVMQVALLLALNTHIKIVYVQTNSKDIFLPIEFLAENLKCVEIGLDEQQLMCHLYLRAMFCYFEQGRKYKANENIGLANRCFLDAKHALEKVQELIN